MASHAWILLGCTLLAVCLSTEGLEMDFVRSPSNIFCGSLHCKNDVNQDVSSSFSTARLVVLEEQAQSSPIELAHIDLNEPDNLFIQPNRASVVNGTGHITKSHVDVILDFQSQTDCLRTVFFCEVQYAGVKGKKEVIRETVTPGEQAGDCTCSAITEQFRALTDRADELDTQIYLQREVSADISSESQDLRQDLTEKRSTLGKLIHDSNLLNENVNNLIEDQQDALEEIAAQSRIQDVLQEDAEALTVSAEKRGQALAVLSAKFDANDVTLGQLKQENEIISAGLLERQRVDAQIQEEIKERKRKNDYLDNELYGITIIFSQLQEEIYNQAQSDTNQASDVSDLRASYDGQVAALSQVGSDFETQTNQIKVLDEADARFRASLDDARTKDTYYDTTLLGVRNNINQYRQTSAALARKDQLTGNQINIFSESDILIAKRLAELQAREAIIGQTFIELTDVDTEISGRLTILKGRDDERAVLFKGLRDTDVDQQRRITNQSVRYQEAFQRLQTVLQKLDALLASLKKLIDDVADLQYMVLASQVTTVTRTTTKLTAVKCTRGMPHTDAREQVLVNGVAVLCDTETAGFGGLVVGSRRDGSTRFDGRSFEDYVEGFGRIDGDFWVGLRPLRDFVQSGYNVLRFDITYKGRQYYALYTINVGDESSNYQLTVTGYTGDAGDALSYHSGSAFSVPEEDNDKDPRRNCAEISGGGGWWFNACTQVNFSGKYGVKGPEGIFWSTLSTDEPVSSIEMKLQNPNEEQVSQN